jgi:PAS domain S-box-containing protein
MASILRNKRARPDQRAERIRQLEVRLSEATATLEAIRSGAVDAVVVHDPRGPQVFTLKGADHPYRLLVEAMSEGAVTLDTQGHILYSNPRFAQMLSTPLERVLGAHFADFVNVSARLSFSQFLKKASGRQATTESILNTGHGQQLAVLLSSNPLKSEVKGVCMVVTDFTTRKLAEEARAELAKQVLLAQEQERQRVARELHDGVNQLLSTTRHRAQALASHVRAGDGETRARIHELTQLLERTMKEVRLISRNLRPSELDDLGLLPALSSLVDEVAERTSVKLQLIAPKTLPALTPQLELTIYRIAQEALSNVEKHSGATRATVALAVEPRFIRMMIRDNGRSFPTSRLRRKSGWGLLNMRERASYVGGALEIEAKPAKGTSIAFRAFL